ncbi:unnamed protein product [Cuscuta epithymum]|uniref:ZF-HD dimerization-type domain-containing protein n=1 Tax=Cuscuta epithymum TaxID=186058 RepID=A0AAV0EZY5_9ASTE|nr:unnamed protein product [Cuscuta epithymum]
MDFDDNDDEQEDEIEMHHQMEAIGSYQSHGHSGRGGEETQAAALAGGRKSGAGAGPMTTYRHRECLKNHAVGMGGHAVDGCGEFMPAGPDGTLEALKCAACGCHRNFHRKEEEICDYANTSYRTPPLHHRHPPGGGYLPLALPSTCRNDEVSNPSSSAGGEGGSRKRFRTKFTREQKDKMMAFAEQLEWQIQKDDEEAVQLFCANTNIRRQVFKVWMHNNKHTLRKRSS